MIFFWYLFLPFLYNIQLYLLAKNQHYRVAAKLNESLSDLLQLWRHSDSQWNWSVQ